MRIAHLSIIHGPRDNRIFEKECKTLAGAGYDVHFVVGGAPEAQLDGVRFHALSDRAVRPAARSQPRLLARAAIDAFRLMPAVYHLHDAHLIPLGIVLKLAGARVVYDVHEDYGAHARTKLASRPLRGRLKALMWWTLETAARACFDAFVCASPSLARKFPAARTTLVSNFPLHRDYANRSYSERPNRLVCTGALSAVRAFPALIAALERLPRSLDWSLLALGHFRGGVEEALFRSPARARVEHRPWRPFPGVVRELMRSRIGVVLLQPLPNHLDAVRSNKLFEYMAAGLPVIASDLPDWREIVLGVDCGLVVDPDDPAAIAAAIEYLLTHPDEAEAMGRRGRAAVRDRFNWDADAARLLSMYGRLLGEPAPQREQAAPAPQPVAAK